MKNNNDDDKAFQDWIKENGDATEEEQRAFDAGYRAGYDEGQKVSYEGGYEHWYNYWKKRGLDPDSHNLNK